MKRRAIIFAAMAALTSCYDDYVKDFDYTSAYFTYQYDMRTFIAGEDESFDVTACLGGVISNTKDRHVRVVLNQDLVTADLSTFANWDQTVEPFRAVNVFSGDTPGLGVLYHPDVQVMFNDKLSTRLEPLDDGYFTVEGLDGLKIKAGDHFASFKVKATDKLLSDPAYLKPEHAVAFEMLSADADTLLNARTFTIIAVRFENMFYGNWYHGGSYKVKDTAGNVLKEETYPFSIPQAPERYYELTTVSANSVRTDKIIQAAGTLTLTFNGADISISSTDVNLIDDGRKSWFNESKLLQDRELHLNYSYSNADGTITEVSDVLYFCYRMRDGVNEWQDEKEEHYAQNV